MDAFLKAEPPPPAPETRPPAALPDAVRAWFEARPRLRPLNISLQELEGRPVYVLENPASSAFYRAGEREFRFLECLDGRRSVAEILTQQTATAPDSALDPGSALRILEVLRAEGLLDEPGRLALGGGALARPPLIDRLGSLLFWRVSFGNPDRFFGWLCGWMGWAVHPLAWIAGLCLMALGGLTLLRHADRMRDATLGVLAPQNWLWLGIIFVGLRAIHELWHGLTCRSLGARVRDIGVVLIVFFPLGYTDVTSGWGLPSRWHRFLISIAGVFIELCVAAAAVLVWAGTGPSLVNTLAWHTVLTAGISTLVANFNPLQRFDGYYILTDLLDLPNLYAHGQILVRAVARRYLLGIREQPLPSLRERRWRAAAIYGPATLVWRVTILVNILAAAGALFRGAGIVLVCISLVAWGRRPVRQFVQGLRTMPASARTSAMLRGSLIVVAVGAILLLPWRSGVVEPALVDWADRCDVRAGCSGVLNAVSVRPGTQVEEGTEVARIENPDLQAAADRLRAQVAKEDLRAGVALREGDMPAWTAANAAAAALRADFEHAEEKAGRRNVVAPAAGVVYDHRLDQRLGQNIKEGELLLTIGHPSDREAVVLIPQERHALYGIRLGDRVEVWVPGRSGLWECSVTSIGPAARRQIERPALTTLGGGHLEVSPRPRGELEGEGGYELHDPQFEVRVRIEGPGAIALRPGERGYLRARSGPSLPVWRLAYGKLERFWSGLLSRRHG